jgi:TM2 domain-containing membrane protein YozV
MRQPKHRTVAIALALAGLFIPGLHRFYLGQYGWGVGYLIPGLLWSTLPLGMVLRVASVCDGLIYLFQGEVAFQHRFNEGVSVPLNGADPEQVKAMAEALGQLDGLRRDGLMTEYEFERQRRQLLGS